MMKYGMPWSSRAACLGVGNELFFSENEDDAKRAIDTYCSVCVVRADCQDHAFATREEGVWGGMPEHIRLRVERKRRRFTDVEEDKRW